MSETKKHMSDPIKYAHVTVIYDDGENTSILDIPQVEDFDLHVEYEQPAYRRTFFVSEEGVVRKLTLSGKPIQTKDGVYYTLINREKIN